MDRQAVSLLVLIWIFMVSILELEGLFLRFAQEPNLLLLVQYTYCRNF